MKMASANAQRVGLICLLLAVVTVAVYSPVRHFEFLNFDDASYVTANPHVFRGFSSQNFVWAFKNVDAANWHPVTWLSHMLDCELFGYQAGYHHLTNLLFHTVNALLLFGLLRQLTGAIFRSAIVAALFACHPLHIESVAWIAERKDVLSTFFGLLTLMAYARYVQKAEGKRQKAKVYYALALVLFALGLMSKPMLVTLPFVMLLLDYWPLHRFQLSTFSFQFFSRLVLEKLPFLVLSAADSIVTTLAQKSGEAVVDTTALPFASRVANAVMAYASYLRKMVWPADLAAYYPYRHNLAAGEVLVALLVLILVSVLVFRLARRAPYLVLGWLWYLGMLVPVIGLVQVGAQSMADRYTYLPLVGVFVMGVWGAAEILSGLRQRAVIAGVVSTALLAGCLVVTWVQVQYWHDSETLFRRDLELYPTGNAMAHHCVGRALFERGKDAEAVPHLEEVLRLLPDFVPGQLNYANCLSRQGRFSEAMLHYSEAIRLQPENAEGYKCLGTSLAAQLKLDEAQTNFLTAIRLKPDYAEAYMRLGMAEMAQAKTDAALQHLTVAVQIHPDYHEAQFYLAHALADQKKFDEAATHFRAAIKANPAYAAAMNDLAEMWVTAGDAKQAQLTEAIALARRACELTRSAQAAHLETLGAALSEAGQLPEAIGATEKAIAVATSEGQTEMVAQLKKRLELYRAGRSYSGKTVTTPGRSP